MTMPSRSLSTAHTLAMTAAMWVNRFARRSVKEAGVDPRRKDLQQLAETSLSGSVDRRPAEFYQRLFDEYAR
jgi:hypothetical protein